MSGGYMGKILKVNLSHNEMKVETLDEIIRRQFLGGYGIGARIIFSEQNAGVDPMGPENILGFVTGPFSGTQAISGTRYTVVGKSPLTGTWGDANSGGFFSAFLKFAGYDAVFFKGISEKPVFLFIDNGKAVLKSAAHLWGKDTYETEDILKSELGKEIAIACIGPAGEKQSLISCIVHNKGSVAGRSGLGAVMGSKKLKAVVVKGNAEVPVADPEGIRKLREYYLPRLGGHIQMVRKYGTTFTTLPSAESGDSPVKNWGGITSIDFPDATPLGAEPLDSLKLKSTGCYRCPVGCEALLKEGKGEYRYSAGSFRPEYETLAMLGPNCANNNLESIVKSNDICNRYGLDTISAGSVLAFTMECYEKGLINQVDTDGLEMTWGNHRAMVAMLEKIARREGPGDIFADGVRVAAHKIGQGADKYAMHIQGQEIPGHNPIASFHVTTTYLTDATPARHTQGSEEHHSDGLLPKFNRQDFSGRGLAHRIGSNFQHALMCSGVCLFVNMTYPHKDVIAEFMRVVTGWDIDTPELIKIGERIANIRQSFNLREGITLLDYQIPDRVLGKPPHKEGPLAGITVEKDIMVQEFLREMDWDQKTGKPSLAKLQELGLYDVARILYPETPDDQT
jgi:aldehyde:ferredoxin oxidoreductase